MGLFAQGRLGGGLNRVRFAHVLWAVLLFMVGVDTGSAKNSTPRADGSTTDRPVGAGGYSRCNLLKAAKADLDNKVNALEKETFRSKAAREVERKQYMKLVDDAQKRATDEIMASQQAKLQLEHYRDETESLRTLVQEGMSERDSCRRELAEERVARSMFSDTEDEEHARVKNETMALLLKKALEKVDAVSDHAFWATTQRNTCIEELDRERVRSASRENDEKQTEQLRTQLQLLKKSMEECQDARTYAVLKVKSVSQQNLECEQQLDFAASSCNSERSEHTKTIQTLQAEQEACMSRVLSFSVQQADLPEILSLYQSQVMAQVKSITSFDALALSISQREMLPTLLVLLASLASMMILYKLRPASINIHGKSSSKKLSLCSFQQESIPVVDVSVSALQIADLKEKLAAEKESRLRAEAIIADLQRARARTPCDVVSARTPVVVSAGVQTSPMILTQPIAGLSEIGELRKMPFSPIKNVSQAARLRRESAAFSDCSRRSSTVSERSATSTDCGDMDLALKRSMNEVKGLKKRLKQADSDKNALTLFLDSSRKNVQELEQKLAVCGSNVERLEAEKVVLESLIKEAEERAWKGSIGKEQAKVDLHTALQEKEEELDAMEWKYKEASKRANTAVHELTVLRESFRAELKELRGNVPATELDNMTAALQ